MLNSILVQLANTLFKQINSNSISENDFFNLIKKSIRDEISNIILKILIGLILTSLIIFSLIQIGFSFQLFLAKIENGYIYDFIIFGFITIISIILLFKIFNQSISKVNLVKINSNSKNEQIEFRTLIFKLFEGINEGFKKGDFEKLKLHEHEHEHESKSPN